MNFAQLRDALLALAPLERSHVVAVNTAEAEFWRRSQGFRVDWSDKLLGFECGGQQWVSEVCFPCGTADAPNGADLAYMRELLEAIEGSPTLGAPAPIEQRWTASSRAALSPAHSAREGDLFSWVGIIMYLPLADGGAADAQREAITKAFWGEYDAMCRRALWPKYGAHQHWAKIELPADAVALDTVRARLAERFPLEELRAAKRWLDPKNVLGNTLVDTLLLEDDRRPREADARRPADAPAVTDA